MEIPRLKNPKESSERHLGLMFDLLAKEKDEKMISTHLSMISVAIDYINDEQLQIIYSYRNTNSQLIKEGLNSVLLGLDTNEAIEITLQLMDDKYRGIRYWAVFNIAHKIEKDSPSIRIALWKRMDDQDLVIKRMAMVGLAKRKDDRVKEMLKRQYLDKPSIELIGALKEYNDISLLNFIKENIGLIELGPNSNQNWAVEYCEHLDEVISKIEST